MANALWRRDNGELLRGRGWTAKEAPYQKLTRSAVPLLATRHNLASNENDAISGSSDRL
jgi:hypothetical protein